MTLAEKYRPARWSEVVGQREAVASLRSLQKRSGFAGRSFWITGGSGSGKTSLARIIAGEVADPIFTVEIDAQALTSERLREIESEQTYYGWGRHSGRCYIVNEAHALRSWILSRLLVLLEPIPSHCAWIFTTTCVGHAKLFEDQIDGSPLISRCFPVELRDWSAEVGPRTRAVAGHCKRIAASEGLDGAPLASYIRLGESCKWNLRQMLQDIEAGRVGLPAKVRTSKRRSSK